MENYKSNDICDLKLGETIQELIRKQEELKRSEKKYRMIAEATKDIIWEGDIVNKKRHFSGKIHEILGYDAKDLEDFDEWYKIVHPDDLAAVKEGIKEQVSKKMEAKAFEYRVKNKDGNYKWLYAKTQCEFNEDGEAIAVFGAFTDVTELKEQQKRIHDLAYYDPVTGLPNRVILSNIITEKIESAQKNKSKFAMIFMDLDNFKFVNDSFGHLVGDKLLVEVGKRLSEMNNNEIMSFRLGGDEFIILIENIDNEEDVEKYTKYLHKSIESPFCISDNMFHVTHSSGVVIYPEHGDNYAELLKNADMAMYISKELGKGVNTFYDVKMGEAAIEKAEIRADLHRAIENNEFELYYQPIVSTADEKIKGCEALIRWKHPQKGMVPPGKFISVAEENGTIIEIGKWVFVSACEYAKRMYSKGYTDFYVSVNISAHQLLQKGFTDFVINTIKRKGISPEMIVIEITESVLMESLDFAIDKIKELKDNNMKIALDDFGCGYSSLTYLKMLPIDIVKIDKSFIDDIQSENDTKNMTNIIILMAKQLGLKVIAEGVEERHQLNYLKKHNGDMIQGYLISKPVASEEFVNLIKIQN